MSSLLSQQGHCGFTQSNSPGDCTSGWSGSWSTRQIRVENLAGCAEHCRTHCSRCRYVSYAQADDDCSWYRNCPRVTLGTSHVSLAVNLNAQRNQLRVAWLGSPPDLCGEADPNHLRYHCQQWLSLTEVAHVEPVSLKRVDLTPTSASFRRSADVLLVPSGCCVLPDSLTGCLRDLDVAAGDPPVVVMLNKVFEGMHEKMAAIRDLSLRHRVLLVTAPAPLDASILGASAPSAGPSSGGGGDCSVSATWPPRLSFLPYGSAKAFYGRTSTRRYEYDLGFTGSDGRFSQRYAMRAATIGDPRLVARLLSRGVRVLQSGMLSASEYVHSLGSARVWLSTTEAGAHVSTRFFEVLASGRALLLCDRHPDAYAPLGIVEGVHAAMFNTSDEFQHKLLWYLEHESERLRIVEAARALADSHTWEARAHQLVRDVRRAAAAATADARRATKGQRNGALPRCETGTGG